MNIGAIRDAIRVANWNRMDATGGTPTENARTNLPAVLLPHRAALEALEIPPKFIRDIADRASAIERMDAALTRWNATRGSSSSSEATPKL